MVFSSITFIYYFLPILLVIYYLVPRKYRNIILLVFSLLFYYYGEKNYIFLLFISCFINYICGLLINKYESDKRKNNLFLVLGLIFNIGLLFYFKYTNFFIDNFNNIFNLNIKFLNIVLPLGISFFTFQNISYLADIKMKKVLPQKNFLWYFTYIAFFPQLVAGPIVRYSDINRELANRKEDYGLFKNGVIRFIIGLGKKVLIANLLFGIIDSLLLVDNTFLGNWLIALLYTLQIYFDFSGYSDMAIGLGKMFGFNFLENFNYPLIATSITDFWRRWHMSLSSFFRDYIYIPLGGNRKGFIKQLRNIFIVWALTGFWHGASWNFIIWGLYFFVLLIIEKLFLLKYLKKNIISFLYTFILVVISFVIFNITDLNELIIFLKGMFGINVSFISNEFIYYFKNCFLIVIIALIGMSPFVKNKVLVLKEKYPKVFNILEIVFLLVVLLLVTSSLISNSFNPFIYFRF